MNKEISKKAYSLIELSIVILIISILITGALSVSVSSINNAKIKVTRDRMAEIYKAMGTYLITNNRLPCPARLNVAKSQANYGSSAGSLGMCLVANSVIGPSNTAILLAYGAVPTQTLGLSSEMAEDGFGSKISYVIHRNFTSTITATAGGHVTTAPYAPTAPIIQIKENPAATPSVQHAIFVLISHGANKAGAYNANAITQNTSPTDPDEFDNILPTIITPPSLSVDYDDTFISVSSNSDSFDDIVFYKTRNQMIQDFDAMSVIPCQASVLVGPYTANAAGGIYGQTIAGIVPSTTYCPSYGPSPLGPHEPQIKCGAFGGWSLVASCLP